VPELQPRGFLAGRKETIRNEVIEQLSGRARTLFPGNYGLLITPVPGGELPTCLFMIAVACDQPASDPSSDLSSLIICRLGNDIETSLPELIRREICCIDVPSS